MPNGGVTLSMEMLERLKENLPYATIETCLQRLAPRFESKLESTKVILKCVAATFLCRFPERSAEYLLPKSS